MARIVFRRSQMPDQAPSGGEAALRWNDMAVAGGASSLAVATAAVCRSKQEGEAGWRPINAISHILWGPEAAGQRHFTMRYTASGLVLNVVACGFWAWLFHFWQRQGPPALLRSAGRAFGISVLAYITDYYVVPRRFTPGFELCLSRRSFPWLYGALAVGLIVPDALGWVRQKRHRRCPTP